MNRAERERLGGKTAIRRARKAARRQQALKAAQDRLGMALTHFVAHIVTCVQPDHARYYSPNYRGPRRVYDRDFSHEWLVQAENFANEAIRCLPQNIRRQAGL